MRTTKTSLLVLLLLAVMLLTCSGCTALPTPTPPPVVVQGPKPTPLPADLPAPNFQSSQPFYAKAQDWLSRVEAFFEHAMKTQPSGTGLRPTTGR